MWRSLRPILIDCQAEQIGQESERLALFPVFHFDFEDKQCSYSSKVVVVIIAWRSHLNLWEIQRDQHIPQFLQWLDKKIYIIVEVLHHSRPSLFQFSCPFERLFYFSLPLPQIWPGWLAKWPSFKSDWGLYHSWEPHRILKLLCLLLGRRRRFRLLRRGQEMAKS